MCAVTVEALHACLPGTRLMARNAARVLSGAAAITVAQPGQVSFIKHGAADAPALLAATRASLVIVDERLGLDDGALQQHAQLDAVIFSPNARLSFIRALEQCFAPARPQGIHAQAVIEPGAVIGERVYIGPFCSISREAVIGDDVVIHAGSHVFGRVHIGARTEIQANAVIGMDGYGYERDEDGALIKFPHMGGVTIGQDVLIGCGTMVCRGTLGDTVIADGAKIDNLVHVAHNVMVGEESLIIANATLCGGVRVGKGSWVAPSASIINQGRVGDGATVGIHSLVLKPVEDGATVAGIPARRLK